jgi:DNA repair protein RadA/Sms
MAKIKSVFVCQSCGAKYPKWQGQCAQCNAWQSLVEELEQKSSGFGVSSSGSKKGAAAGKVVMLNEVQTSVSSQARLSTGSSEFDRVLGGGMVKGSVVLVGGEPGVGKSTLLTQLALQVQSSDERGATTETSSSVVRRSLSVLYACGEESVEQVGLRVNRLRTTSDERGATTDQLGLLAETNVDTIIATAENNLPSVLIVDSIQTLFTTDLTGMAGSVGQVRESASRLISFAKRHGVITFIVGHVTKEGSIAGPKVLEHMVDVVVQLEGERTGVWRLARAIKNRFGATDEVGVFALSEAGMHDVSNPSGAFLDEAQTGKPGSAIVSVLEGTRPVLVEVQALAVSSQLAMPRRVAQGIALNKLQLMCAVLQKYTKLPVANYDVFVNVAGGLKITDPGADLGIALSIASSILNSALPEKRVAIGEVGLLGEIRKVSQEQRRIKEATAMGYKVLVGKGQQVSLAQLVTNLKNN